MSAHHDHCHHRPWVRGTRYSTFTIWGAGCDYCGWFRACAAWPHCLSLANAHAQEIR